MQTRHERGQGLVEYAIIIVFLAILCIVALQFLAGGISNSLYDTVISNL
ncbi:MAG: pilus assembly protein [Anaerolineales bacterium]|jgi:Flp pilus assembly pilin Flp|nr:pilus assembly protein [Anaerolineales bacterium]MBX3004772.1 pilus assembly protein [Anaerolineales bacterium]MCW5838390.1 pilus assembly protein [Anaerolineales bacterium]MCW5887668.1 pilus assembly protein [Anaerolineales bacterium]